MMNRPESMLFYLLLILCLVSCTSTIGPVSGGSGSDVEARTAVITGSIVDSTGIPLANATVRLRLENFLSGDSYTPSEGKINQQNTATDSNGIFSIDSVDSGKYIIEAVSGDTLGAIVMCEVLPGDTAVQFLNTVAMPMSDITGTVDLNGVSPDSVSVRLFGLDYETHPDSTGEFHFHVPSGKHHVIIEGVYFPEYFSDRHIDTVHTRPGDSLYYDRRGNSEPCEDWPCDSNIVARFLMMSGYTELTVDSVAVQRDGRLVGLNLRGLGITFIHPMLRGLDALEKLDCGNNQIEDPGPFLENAASLVELKLDSNSISEITSDLSTLTDLTSLDLSSNNLQTLPLSITDLPLVELDVGDNELCVLEENVEQWVVEHDGDFRESQRCQ